MKKLLAVTALFISLCPGFSFAQPKDCQTLAEDAAMKFATPAKPSDGMSLTLGSSKLVRQTGTTLIFEVEIFAQYCDGNSSEEFPSDYYLVKATGDAKRCRIVSVRGK